MPKKRIRFGLFVIGLLGFVLLNGMVGAQGSVIATISVPFALSVAVNPATGTIYAGAGNPTEEFIAVIDGATNSVTDSIPTNTMPFSMALIPDTNRIYLPDQNNDQVIVVDLSNNTILTTVTVGDIPYNIAGNTSTNQIYLVELGSHNVTVIDGDTNTVVDTLAFDEQISEIAVNSGTNRIYVTKDTSYDIDVIDGDDNSLITSIDDAILDGVLTDIAINDFTNQIYVSIVHPGTFEADLVQIDGDSNVVVDSIPLPDSPNAVAVNSIINHIYLVTTNQLSSAGKIYTVDGNTNTIIDITSIGKNFYDVDVDPVTSRVYIVGDLSEGVEANTREYARLTAAQVISNLQKPSKRNTILTALPLLQNSGNTIAVYQDIRPPLVGPKRNYFRMNTPTLTWSRVDWAIGYEIEVDDNSDFKTNEFHDATISSGTLSATTTALDDGQYYWRVRGKRANGSWGNWSTVQIFAVNA